MVDATWSGLLIYTIATVVELLDTTVSVVIRGLLAVGHDASAHGVAGFHGVRGLAVLQDVMVFVVRTRLAVPAHLPALGAELLYENLVLVLVHLRSSSLVTSGPYINAGLTRHLLDDSRF
jgi:hypothetical protein